MSKPLQFQEDSRWAGVMALLIVGFLGFGVPLLKPGTQVPFWLWPTGGWISLSLLYRRSVTFDAVSRTLTVTSWRPWRRTEDVFGLDQFQAVVLGPERETKQGVERDACLGGADDLMVEVTTLKGKGPHPELDNLVKATGLPVKTVSEFNLEPVEETSPPLPTNELDLTIRGRPGAWPMWGLLSLLSLIAFPTLLYFGITLKDQGRAYVSLGALSFYSIWVTAKMAGVTYHRGLSTRIWANSGSLHVEKGGKPFCRLSQDSLDEVLLDVRQSACSLSPCEVVVIRADGKEFCLGEMADEATRRRLVQQLQGLPKEKGEPGQDFRVPAPDMNDGGRAFRLAGITILAAVLLGCLYSACFLGYHRYFTDAKVYGPGQYIEEHQPAFRLGMPRWLYWTVVTGQGFDQKVVYMGPTGHSMTIGYRYNEWRPVGWFGHPYIWVILLPVFGFLLTALGRSVSAPRLEKLGIDCFVAGFMVLPVLFFILNNLFAGSA